LNTKATAARGAAMLFKKAKKKAKNEITGSAMQSVKAKVAAASNGEVKLKDGKKMTRSTP
jgi:hypothetical protein